MFRRVFWFASGAVAGVTGLSWAKRRAAEMREAVTVASVARALRDAVVRVYRSSRVFLAGQGLSVPGRTGNPAPGSAVADRPGARRHIATRPHNSHR